MTINLNHYTIPTTVPNPIYMMGKVILLVHVNLMRPSVALDTRVQRFITRLINQVMMERIKMVREGYDKETIDKVQIINWTRYFYENVLPSKKPSKRL